ncbi:hypothetical protein CCR87_13785 [Rhodobaculum claviforme]|uniref:UvrD-like helicase C-terminal domain-containing protein n=2 Tax=Rhodobaculum claviforme TaxID=1549854 RepID=A0A934TMQ8_9RHOB|nr:hypothetical protein [Rhodobaculum claviforme]
MPELFSESAMILRASLARPKHQMGVWGWHPAPPKRLRSEVLPLRIERFGGTVVPGHKVMQIGNDCDKDVHNGDIGMITVVDEGEGAAAVDLDGRTVPFAFGERGTLVPAHAATIHKSQGSEHPAVVIPVMTRHFAKLQRNLIHTGVIRGKALVVLAGQKKAAAIAVKNVSGRRRWSRPGDRLAPVRSQSI